MCEATLKIVHDDDAEAHNPRQWDNLGTMVCWHDRYKLGDEQPSCTPEEWMLEEVPRGAVCLPLFLYDHSGITMRCSPFECKWDSGQVGYIYTTPERIKEAFALKDSGVVKTGSKLHKRVTSCLVSEVAVYDQFLRGAIWGYMAERPKEKCPTCGHVKEYEEDSCWGFFGDSLEETGIRDHVPKWAEPLLEQAWEDRQ